MARLRSSRREGVTVRLARSLDRPMRYFLAKRHEGPALYVADRIDTTARRARCRRAGRTSSIPSYTRMVPAHYVVEIALVGCPDPDPVYTRFFTPTPNALPPSLDEIGRRYVGAMAARNREVAAAHRPAREPIGVAFSGGIDSGAVFLVIYHTMMRLGLSPARLKAFVLNLGAGPDVDQARAFLSAVGLSLFLEEIDSSAEQLSVDETLRVLEDYKPLDVECAAMGLELCRGIRARYPDWRHLADGDGGDENLKDYPIEENHELTIRSVIDNLMLYQEGWGVGRIKHSLTYSGGLSRSYVRTYAPARRYGFDGFSPYAQPARRRDCRRHSVRGADALRRADALRAQRRNRRARREGGHRDSTCRSSRSGDSSTARCRPRRCTRDFAAPNIRTGARSTASTRSLTEGLCPSDSPTRSLARRFAGALRSRGSLAALARAAQTALAIYEINSRVVR